MTNKKGRSKARKQASVRKASHHVNDYERDHSWPAKPMTSAQLEAFDRKVEGRVKSQVLVPANPPPRPGRAAEIIDLFFTASIMLKGQPPRGLSQNDLILLRGEGHRVVFSIQELEAIDAVEQMVEEMADENMNWLSAIDTVARLRRGHYSKMATGRGPSIAMKRRRDDAMPIQMRLLEYFELASLTDDDHECQNNQNNTNLDYWGDRHRAMETELLFFVSYPNIIRVIYDNMPWFRERGFIQCPVSLMMTVKMMLKMNESEEAKKIIADSNDRPEVSALMTNPNPDFESSKNVMDNVMKDLMKNLKIDGVDDEDFELIQKAEQEIKSVDMNEWKMLNWVQSRKPGIKLPYRPRQFFEDPEFTEICPCCREQF